MRAWRAALLGTLLIGTPSVRTDAQQVGKEHTVTIENMAFNPPALTVRAGDRVVWVNKDLFPHTATTMAAGFDSGAISPNKSWTYIVTKSGTFEYKCTFHPNMKGVLTVRND